MLHIDSFFSLSLLRSGVAIKSSTMQTKSRLWNERFGDFRCFGELVAINQNFNAIIARVAQKQRSIYAIHEQPAQMISQFPAMQRNRSVKMLLLPIELLAFGIAIEFFRHAANLISLHLFPTDWERETFLSIHLIKLNAGFPVPFCCQFQIIE